MYAGYAGRSQLGVQAVLDMGEFNKNFDQYMKSIQQLESSINRLAALREAADKRREEAAKRAEENISRAINQTRRDMVTMLYFVRLLERGWSAAWGAMENAVTQGSERMGIRALARSLETDLGGTAQQIRDLADGAISVQDSMQVVLQGLLTDQGQFSDEYGRLWEAARVAAVTGMADADEAFEAFVTDLVEGTGETTDAIHPIYGIQAALQSYAAASSRTVEQLSQEEAAHVTLQQIYKTTSMLLEEGADEALEYSNSWNRVQARMTELKEVFGIFVSDNGLLKLLNDLIVSATQSLAMLGAGFATVKEMLGAGGLLGLGAGGLGGLIGQQLGAAAAGDPSDIFARHMQKYADALGLFRDEVDKSAIDYEGMREAAEERKTIDYSPIVDHLMKREQLIEDHTHRVEKIWERFYDRQEKAELNYNKAIDRAHRQADREEERARRRYERQREHQETAMNRRLEKLREEHYLRLTQNAREYHLQEIQSEALYQYERGQLVAYGDVLGIEDLDARYALETEARAQNFDEQQRQERENYELRRKYMMQELQEQLEYLRQGLEEQLEEIRLREQERMDEAAERRKEELEAAEQAREQQLEEEARQHERSLEQWNQYWTKLAHRFELGLYEVREILKMFFGSGGELDEVMREFGEKWTTYMGYLTQINQLMANLRKGAVAPTPQLPGVAGGAGAPRYGGDMPYQYGGSRIVNRPTRMIFGEGYMPEMISAQPMSSLSTVKLSWTGGPIPVSGTGMEGADTSGIGDAIAQGLLVALEKQFVKTGATYA